MSTTEIALYIVAAIFIGAFIYLLVKWGQYANEKLNQEDDDDNTRF